MTQVFADGAVVYDSRLDDYKVLGLAVHPALNKGGTAEITLPPNHPKYNAFVSYKTLVEIYRNNKLKFRGRALYPSDDFLNRRKITCEGEKCFLRDAIMRPYLYQDSPANIFTAAITEYNSQVDSWKQFVVGTITVTDPNDYIRLESDNPETVMAFVDKLIDRCGGYIVFTNNISGQRVINWYATLGYQSSQTIRFGENLLDFARSDANTSLATRIIPYGAKLDDGTRLTIESVNNGLDYIQDDEAAALRGIITTTVTWDDVTEPANLLTKAQQYLATSKMMITSLDLSAADLSLLPLDTTNYPDLPLTDDVAAGVTTQKQSVWGTNILINGDFSNGATGWQTTDMTITPGDHELTCVSTAADSQLFQTFGKISGHVYYLTAWVKASKAGITLSLWGGTSKAHSGSGNYELLTLVVTAGSTGTSHYSIYNTNSGDTITVKYLKLVDLTADVSPVPAKAQMDAMCAAYPNSWFSGKAKLTDDIVTYVANSPSPNYPSPLVNAIKAGTYRYTRNGREYVASLPEMHSVGGVADTWDADTGSMAQPDGAHVFDGTENWFYAVNDNTSYCSLYLGKSYLPGSPANNNNLPLLCSHFPYGNGGQSSYRYRVGTWIYGYPDTSAAFMITAPVSIMGASATTAKAWMAAQYAAGTPLTVHYPYATPITSTITPTLASSLHADVDSFDIGDNIRVISAPHSVDDWFLLTERTEDLLDPSKGSISLGKDKASLAGSDVAGDRKSASDLEKTVRSVKADYQLGIASAIQQATTTLQSLIQQTSDSITSEVSKTYATGDDLSSYVATKIKQLSDGVDFQFTTLKGTVDANDADARTQLETINKYIKFDNGNIVIGIDGSTITLHLEHDRILFLDKDAEVAYISNMHLYVTDAYFLSSLRIGAFAFIPRKNGNLSLIKVDN